MLHVRKTICPKTQKLTKNKEHNGALNFATDACTLPNHKAFIVVPVHLEQEGVPLYLVVVVVKVAEV